MFVDPDKEIEANHDLIAVTGALAALEELDEVADEPDSVIEESLIRALAKLSTLESALDPDLDVIGSTSFDARGSDEVFGGGDDYEDDFEDYEGTLAASRLSQLALESDALETTC